MNDNQITQETLKQLGIGAEELQSKPSGSPPIVVKQDAPKPNAEHVAQDSSQMSTVGTDLAIKKLDEKDARTTELEEQLQTAEQQRDAAIAKVKILEDSHREEAENAKAQASELTAQREATEKVAKAAKAELEDIGGQLQESQRTVSSLHSKLGTLEAEIGAMKCPDCGAIVDWDIMPIRECPLESYKRGNPEEWCLILGKVEMVKYRRCPHCKHVEWYPDKVEVKT